MDTTLITWACIAALSAVVCIARTAHAVNHWYYSRHRHNFLEAGSEWEEIYVPGDRRIKDDYDYDEFED